MLSALIKSTIFSVPQPYMGEPNLTITWEVGTGVFATDSVGNEVEVKRIVVVLASVRESDRYSLETKLPGSGQYQMFVEGRLVEPKLIPPEIGLELIGRAVFRDRLRGEFRMLPAVQHRDPQISDHMGAKIAGVITVSGAV